VIVHPHSDQHYNIYRTNSSGSTDYHVWLMSVIAFELSWS